MESYAQLWSVSAVELEWRCAGEVTGDVQGRSLYFSSKIAEMFYSDICPPPATSKFHFASRYPQVF